MTKVSRTFRLDQAISSALDKLHKRNGDYTYHVECALAQYKPIKEILIAERISKPRKEHS